MEMLCNLQRTLNASLQSICEIDDRIRKMLLSRKDVSINLKTGKGVKLAKTSLSIT